jgi:two-component system NtrC family response regulator
MSERRLLVVEDDTALRKQLRWSLDAFKVLEAGTREQALAALRADEPQVVLLDLGLPPDAGGVREGFATLGEMLALAPATKVVVMTGQEGREHALAAIASGAHDFHKKPVDPDHLAPSARPLLPRERARGGRTSGSWPRTRRPASSA